MPEMTAGDENLQVPDRFERLRDVGSGKLQGIVVPVEDTLRELDVRFVESHAAGRGGLLLLRGESGAGKSTFLDTVGLFRRDVETVRLAASEDVARRLQALPSHPSRIVVLEGREALRDVSNEDLEAALHSINEFVRATRGQGSLVVWPTNTDELAQRLAGLAHSIGGHALLGLGEAVVPFSGPEKGAFVSIAERTISALNEGATLATLGISEERANHLAATADNVGHYLGLVRSDLIRNGARVRALMKSEQVRLWVVVICGSDTDGDVAALTRGSYSAADIDRLLTSTGANVVADLKEKPDTLGILGTVMDAKIIDMDVMTALAVARTYGDPELHSRMRALNMSITRDAKADERLLSGELGAVFSGRASSTRRRGMKPRSNTLSAFENLTSIARQDDGLLNKAVGAALVATGLADSFQTEVPIEGKVRYVSDLYLEVRGEPVRVEMMWRTRSGRADIANYTLGKLSSYSRVIGWGD